MYTESYGALYYLSTDIMFSSPICELEMKVSYLVWVLPMDIPDPNSTQETEKKTDLTHICVYIAIYLDWMFIVEQPS